MKDLVEIKKRINSSVNIEQDRLISSNEQYLNNVNNSLTQFSRRLRKPKAIELVDLTEDEIETACNLFLLLYIYEFLKRSLN